MPTSKNKTKATSRQISDKAHQANIRRDVVHVESILYGLNRRHNAELAVDINNAMTENHNGDMIRTIGVASYTECFMLADRSSQVGTGTILPFGIFFCNACQNSLLKKASK